MHLRIVATVSAALAALAGFAVAVVAGLLGLGAIGALNSPGIALLLGASLIASVIGFRATHDWIVLRWSNEARPFLYGPWRYRHIL